VLRLGSSSSTSERSRTKLVYNDSSSDDDDGEKRRLSPRRKVTVDPSTIDNLLNFSDTEDDFDDEMSGDENAVDESSRRRRRISVATLLSRQTSVESTATLDDDFVCYVRKKEQNHQVEERGRKMSVTERNKERTWKKKCKFCSFSQILTVLMVIPKIPLHLLNRYFLGTGFQTYIIL
jgi:hypothetical protein